MRLTLRTLLAYLDDTLEPHEARDLGLRVQQSEYARELVERIKKSARRRSLATPSHGVEGDVSDPNTVAEYLSDALSSEQVERVEENCLTSEAHLAEIASCHQILTLVLTEPVRVPPTANRRMYKLVRRPASQPDREPGRTIPISGSLPVQEIPEVEEQDAALLLGMSRYKPGGPLSGRIFQGALVAGLAVCLLVALFLAWPASLPRGPLIGSEITVAAAPTPKPSETAPPPKPSPTVEVKAKTPEPPVEPKAPEVVVKPEPPMPPAPPPGPPAPPRLVRKPIGKLEAADQVLVVAKTQDGSFERILSANPDVMTNDPLVCLPGYKAKIRLNAGVEVDLWANTPEQYANTVFETRLRFHEPADAFDADLTLTAGRIFLMATKPAGAKVRIRTGDAVWEAVFPDEKAEILVEVVPSLDAGVPFIKEVNDTPRISMAVAQTRGTVALNLVGVKDFGSAPAPRFFTGDNKTDEIEESNDPERRGYFGRFLNLPPDPSGVQQTRSIAMQKNIADLAANCPKDGLKTRLAEMLSEETDPLNGVRMLASRYAVYAAAAIDEPVYLVEALNSGIKPFQREAATFALSRWLPVDGGNSQRLYQQFLVKQFGEEPTLTAMRLLRRYTPEDLKRPDTLDGFVNLMETSEFPAIRDLAHWTLMTFVDPMAFENPKLTRFIAGGTAEEREPTVNAWRQRLGEIKKRNMEEGKK